MSWIFNLWDKYVLSGIPVKTLNLMFIHLLQEEISIWEIL